MTIGHNGGPMIRGAGWYATHRDMLTHPIVGIGKAVKPLDANKPALSRFEAWHWLIANAAYKAKPVDNKGRVAQLQPGQVMGARSYLSKEWNWSEMTVRWFLKVLLDENMITLATDKIRNQPRTNTANIITLCNYLKYQLGEDEQQPAQQPANNQPTTTQQPQSNKVTNNNEVVVTRESANDLTDLYDQLLDACNGSLDNPVNCSALLSLAIPQMWMNEGADLQLDILPTLRAVGKQTHSKRINSWAYFTRAVAIAKQQRVAGLPDVPAKRPASPGSMSLGAKIRAHKERQNQGTQS